jgi:YebC/PmpR family DNA-binding regulatory protein
MVDEAKAANMPKDTIQKAIDKGSGNAGTENFESVTYECYGPGGVAMLIEALTDNRARTAPDLRSTLDKYGGNLATSGAVSFVFAKKGVLLLKGSAVGEEQLMELALEAGAEDVTSDGSYHQVVTAPGDYLRVKEAIERAKLQVEDAQLTHLPSTTVSLDADQSTRFTKLLDTLDDNDDVQNVYHNAELAG